MAERGQSTISGKLHLADDVAPGATASVVLEDVSRADDAATVVAEVVVPLEAGASGDTDIPFSIPVPKVDETARYAVRAHVDTTGSGEVTQGDLISTQSYPVLTHGHSDHVDVEARRI